jgi:glycosyltransferase involved in cell wall biosynthesis
MRKPMRVIWVSHRDVNHPRAGGAERSAYEIMRRLAFKGHAVTILSPGGGGLRSEVVQEGVDLVAAGGIAKVHLDYPLRVRSIRPDVVVEDLAHVLPWAGPRLTNVPGVAYFRHLHARTLSGQVSLPVAGALKIVERCYPILYGDWQFVTDSYSSQRDLVSMGISPSQCVPIPPGVDTGKYVMGTKGDEYTLLYFGGMRLYKRPLDVLFACQELDTRGWEFKLYMVGDGPALEVVRRNIHALGLEEKVRLTGRLTESQLIPLIQSAHVNLHCSVAEGWCLSAMEAAACGVPTVGYRVPGLNESVLDGRTGLLVRDGDRLALSDAVETVLGGPESWANNCRRHAESHSWDVSATRWEELLHATMEAH